jgi:hypothetical protein
VERRADYVRALDRGDVGTLGALLGNFFRNSGVAGLWVYRYYERLEAARRSDKRAFVMATLRDLDIWSDLVGGDLAQLDAPRIGNPWGYVVDGHLVMPVSPQLHRYAHLASNLLGDVERPVVAEIGGGFGGFAYHLLRGRSCTYLNFDLPEILLIASYYLLKAFPERRALLYGERSGALTPAVVSDYDMLLLPHYALPTLSAESVDLIVNTASLSEMGRQTVAEYLSQVGRICQGYFFHDNSDRPVLNTGGHVEIPSSQFPIPASLKLLSKTYAPFGGGAGRYREHLYERRADVGS